MNSSQTIKASEISEYLFCSIAWYMRRCGHAPEHPRIEKGIEKHVKIGKQVVLLQEVEKSGRRALYIAGGCLIIAILLFSIRWLI